MKNVLLVAIVAMSSTAFSAEKVFLVDGKQVTPQAAVTAGMAHKKVQRCAEVAGGATMLVDGKIVDKAMKCSEVALYKAKSGLPTWKTASTGEKW